MAAGRIRLRYPRSRDRLIVRNKNTVAENSAATPSLWKKCLHALEGELEDFFTSGQTWFDVFWTAPQGNAYYNLAHQYMAAVLNQLAGASSTPEVDAALAFATDWFQSSGPGPGLGPAAPDAPELVAELVHFEARRVLVQVLRASTRDESHGTEQ